MPRVLRLKECFSTVLFADKMTKKISLAGFLSFAVLLAVLPPGGFSAWTWQAGIRWVYFFMLSFFASLAFVPVSCFIALKFKAIDKPDERRIHKGEIPRLGGLAVWAAFIASFFRNTDFSLMILGIALSSSIVFFIGVYDDIKKASAYFRLFFQFLAASAAFFCGLKIRFFYHMGFAGEIISYLITVFWLVGILNAFNFMDGIDGLAASMGLFCSVCFTVLGVLSGQMKLALFSAALSGACAGFLIYNWNPAKVFLGDCGSTFIGFSLGIMAIYATWAENAVLPSVAGPVLILGIPIFDLIYTSVSRIKNGKVSNFKEWLEYAGKDHFHHRLLNLGFDVKKAVAFILTLNLMLGLQAVEISVNDKNAETYINLFQGFLLLILVAFLMITARNREIKGEQE